MDQLNMHSPASLSAAFPPAEAKRVKDRLEIPHTIEQGSWLNKDEPKPAVPQRECLGRRLGVRAAVEREVTARADRRDAAPSAFNWRFATADARIKLRRLSSALEA